MKKLLFFLTLSFGMLFSQQIVQNEIPGKIYAVNFSSLQNAVNTKKSSSNLIKNVSITLPNYSGEKVIFKLQENDLSAERATNVTTFNGSSTDGNATLKLSLFDDYFVAIIKNKVYLYLVLYNK